MRPLWTGGGGWPVRVAFAAGSVAALAACVGLAVTIGEIRVPLLTAGQAISNRLFGSAFAVNRVQAGVIWDYRLSRALLAACCGGGLAICGAVLQALLRNPLAEPYVLGVSAGASTGAVAVVILGAGGGSLSLSGGAFVGAVAALLIVAGLAAGSGGGERIILAGIAGGQLFNALTSYIVATAANAEQARGVMFWLLGNLSGVRWHDVALAAPLTFAAALLCLLHARALDAFTFGADAAASLGVNVTRVRLLLFGLTAAITATMVSIVGSIGFVGLVIPHAARFLVGPGHGRLLPASLVVGACFTVLADVISRTLVSQQTLPIGVVTALFGAPAFAVILFRARRR
ncbi:MAG: iron ABC transporter permease [Acidisphaera sp.]|nr:iron ABC transporter permease [Acidisphaera sp.]MBV9811423.1 iron ABC transporter permease [Acetobacteraceae bacterium]